MSYQSGFCITRHHANCKGSQSYYEKTWYCECSCHSNTETQLEPTPVPADKATTEQRSNMKLQTGTQAAIVAGSRLAIKEGNSELTARDLAIYSANAKGLKYANAYRNYERTILELASAGSWIPDGNETLSLELANPIEGKQAVKLTLTTTVTAMNELYAQTAE